MKICHVSASDSGGGAARAAFRLHMALQESGFSSIMQVAVKHTDELGVCGPSGRIEKAVAAVRPVIDQFLCKINNSNLSAYRSLNFLPSTLLKRKSVGSADVINLHWLGGGSVSIGQLGEIDRPCVWTLHDMWPFCGAEHLAPDSPVARWRNGYPHLKNLADRPGVDFDRLIWMWKKRTWRRPIPLIAPSNWLARCIRQSSLMKDWPVFVVPNVLDTSRFRPVPKKTARSLLNLPPDIPLVLFGAMGGGRDPNKGWDLLHSALLELSSTISGIECVVFGQSKPADSPCVGMPVHWLGHLHDDVTLNLVYSAADVMVVPSRQENLPQSGTEAHSCGCPVVAFDVAGLPDVVEHQVTGYLAAAYDSSDLANGIRWVLEDDDRYSRMCLAARDRAVNRWSPAAVVPQYLNVYEQTIDSWIS
ncbi:glycosyltransferase [Castellaniella sp.]|uniref:glycosyltransferase n=1 Tax=Castellaniella sp. TaxID=1955812 RepID=UPI002AFFA12F|nr:glycosyltransferase [Castellaniella sp.]